MGELKGLLISVLQSYGASPSGWSKSYRCGRENNGMRFHDFSGEPIPIVGYIDLQINNATGKEHEYRWTRLLVVGEEFKGEERMLIIGRHDLKFSR